MNPRMLAVAMAGKFKSYFEGKTVPPVEKKEEEQPDEASGTAQTPDAGSDNRTVVGESPETKIIVVGNARFIEDNFCVQFEGNRTFFLNSIDWFTIGDALMGIRSREAGESPLQVISDNARAAVRFVNMFGVSVLLALFGLVQYYLRKRRKRLGIKELQ